MGSLIPYPRVKKCLICTFVYNFDLISRNLAALSHFISFGGASIITTSAPRICKRKELFLDIETFIFHRSTASQTSRREYF